MVRIRVSQRLSALCVAVGLGFGAMVANGQSTTQGAIAGTVEDVTGAVLPAATVTIHNDGTSAEQHLTADSNGYFDASLLEPGTYTVTITAAGFGDFKSSQVIVQVGQVTSLTPHLKAGADNQVVQVSAETPVLNFESPDFSSNLNTKALDNIPVNNRRWSSLALTTPGVVSDSNGFGLVSVRGISPILNNILNEFAAPALRVQNLPETVELTLRAQPDAGRLLIHLINFTGTMRRPISSVVKITGAVLEIPRSTLAAAGIQRIGSVSALRSGVRPAFVESAANITLTVPPMDEYEVLSLSERKES